MPNVESVSRQLELILNCMSLRLKVFKWLAKRSVTLFFWKLKNISYCLEGKDEAIESPTFVVDSIHESKWKLALYPRGEQNANYIAFYLFRETDTPRIVKEEIKYDLALISKDGSVLTHVTTVKYDFSETLGHGYPLFAKREDVFVTKRSEFLPQDTLLARCRIWKSNGDMTNNIRCFAHTRIGVQKRSFQWNVKNFSNLEPEKKSTYQIKSIEDDSSLMSIDLSLSGALAFEEIVNFKLSLQDDTKKFSTLRLFLVDAAGNLIQCNREEFWFDDPSESKQFKFVFTKNKLMAMKSSFTPDDILSLHWEWAFSEGVVSDTIEDVQYAFTSSETKLYDAENKNNRNVISLSYALNDNLKSLYDEKFLCDVKLITKTSTFNAHKVILSASSSVFKAMFSNDMKEKERNCVNIEDLSDDTISKMLVYIYTTRMEDLTWESATHVYVAADKYAIPSLKNICSSYLQDNLSPSNACEILLLSDLHADGNFRTFVQNYILNNIKCVVSSEEWKLLMETNAKLAAETLSLPYK